MDDSFLFCINASLPMLFLLLLGMGLRKKQVVDENYVERTNDILFWIVGPSILLNNMIGAELSKILDWQLLLLVHGMLILVFAVTWMLAAFSKMDKSSLGAFVHSVFRGNFGYIGVPLIMLMFSSQMAAKAAIIQVATMPAINIMAVILLSVCTGSKKRFKDILRSIVLNPLILAAVVGLAAAVFKVQVPEVIQITLRLLAQLSLPLSLILIGATFDAKTALDAWRLTAIGAVIKSVAMPAIAIAAAMALGVTGENLIILLFYGASPTAVNAYIMTRKMGGNHQLNATIIVLSTLLSTVSLFIGLYWFKAQGML